jgi:hypothetical protein
MKLFTSKFRLLTLMVANLLVMASMYAEDPSVGYMSDEQIRDERIRDEKWRDERIRDENRRDQDRDDRRREESREDRRRENRRNDTNAGDSDGGRVKPVRNLHPELQIASPRNQGE